MGEGGNGTHSEQTRKVQRAFQIASLGDTSRSRSLLYFIIRYFNPQLSTGEVYFASPSEFTEKLNSSSISSDIRLCLPLSTFLSGGVPVSPVRVQASHVIGRPVPVPDPGLAPLLFSFLT